MATRLPNYDIPANYIRLDDHVTAADSFINVRDRQIVRQNQNILNARSTKRQLVNIATGSILGVAGGTYGTLAYYYSARVSHRNTGDCLFSIPLMLSAATQKIKLTIEAYKSTVTQPCKIFIVVDVTGQKGEYDVTRDVISVGSKTINAQDETNYDNSPTTEGTFSGGTGHAVSDIITLSDGTTITVDAVSSGVVTQFTVSNTNSNGSAEVGSTLSQVSTTGSGINFSLTVDQANLTNADPGAEYSVTMPIQGRIGENTICIITGYVQGLMYGSNLLGPNAAITAVGTRFIDITTAGATPASGTGAYITTKANIAQKLVTRVLGLGGNNYRLYLDAELEDNVVPGVDTLQTRSCIGVKLRSLNIHETVIVKFDTDPEIF